VKKDIKKIAEKLLDLYGDVCLARGELAEAIYSLTPEEILEVQDKLGKDWIKDMKAEMP
jgi:hypothetical protein